MNTLKKVLEDNLKTLGLESEVIENAIQKLDISLVENKLSDVNNYSKYVDLEKYEEPTTQIIKAFININNAYIQSILVTGDIEKVGITNSYGKKFMGANYSVAQDNIVIAISNDFRVKIFAYIPNEKTKVLYNNAKYEDLYCKDRIIVMKEYKEAFEQNRKLNDTKIEEILSLLASDYIFDEMLVNNLNPRIRMYDEPDKYAENITNYSLKFINNKSNRIETYEKSPKIRLIGGGVTPGYCTNDPYIKIQNLPPKTNFPLNIVSYYWIKENAKKQEEIAIFPATTQRNFQTYVELKQNDEFFLKKAKEVLSEMENKNVFSMDTMTNFVSETLKRLNYELVNPSLNILTDDLHLQLEDIFPISYIYNFVSEPSEFEEKLYTSIEDNIGKDYKYKISEQVIEDLTRVGTKMEYTTQKGELVKRQSIADFNVNAPTAVLRKETFIDSNRIPNLLEYIYENASNDSNERLPIPSLNVEIYVPKNISNEVEMFNGTSLNFSIDGVEINNNFENRKSEILNSLLPGKTYATVKYIDSKDRILKENKIMNLEPNTSFCAEFIPIINDIEGKEWRADLSKVEPIILQLDPSANIIRIRYSEVYARVRISFYNKEGIKIANDAYEMMQIGENYDSSKNDIIVAKDKEEWTLKNQKPSKFIATANEGKNIISLFYEIEKADIIINFIDKSSQNKLVPSKKISASIRKVFSPDIIRLLEDENGLCWNFLEESTSTILPKLDEENIINLYYEAAKVPVIIKFINEKGESISQDKTDFIQIGKKYKYSFDEKIIDFEHKEWELLDKPKEIIVNKKNNEVIGAYKPKLVNVVIKLLSVDNKLLKPDIIQKAQIGEFYAGQSFSEIADSFGKYWKCVEDGTAIVINEQEVNNKITLKFKPLMSKVTIKFLDTESNELLKPKYEEIQVGTEYKNRPIERITDKDGKHWIINYENIKSLVVKKYEEENIQTIYYEKEMVSINVSFKDAFGNSLAYENEIKWQIGDVFSTKQFEKIKDKNNKRWMLENTEPKNLVVKENNNFIKLIYGEMKAKVLIKCIDVKTQKSIIDNEIITTKLDGIFAPSIQKKVLDKNKYLWKYIGDNDISIVAKENEEENIIVLNYEEAKSKIILKYSSDKKEKIREDAIKEVQVGKEIKIEPLQRVIDNNGLHWKYEKMKQEGNVVKEEDNIIYLSYLPLMTNIEINYLNDEHKEIADKKIIDIQVGQKYTPEKIERLFDNDKKLWKYSNISQEEIIAKEGKNDITLNYAKLLSKITLKIIDEEKVSIEKDIIFEKQIGSIFKVPYEKEVIDGEGKVWQLIKPETDEIIVQENIDSNVVNIFYEKELSEIKINYLNSDKQIIKQSTKDKAQIGCIYDKELTKEIIDEKTGLGYKLPDGFVNQYKVQRENNVIDVYYEVLNVEIIVTCQENDGTKILDDAKYIGQVGSIFKPEIDRTIVGKDDREWLYGILVNEKDILGTKTKQQDEEIVVKRNISENVLTFKYRPSMTKVVIKYEEPLGNSIKADLSLFAQIGSIFDAEIIETIEDSKNVKWVFNPNSSTSIKISREEKNNVVILGYEEEKALVTYKYQDEYHNRLRAPKRKLVQIGSLYKPEIENIIEDFEGKVWEFKASNVSKLEVKEEESTNTIELIYNPLNVDVLLKHINLQGKQIIKDKPIKAQLGSEFTPNIDEKITDENSKLFKFNKIEPESAKIVEVPLGALETPNKFILTYEAVYSNVIVCYKTIDGNSIKEDDKYQVQVGTMFDINIPEFIKDESGIQWQLVTKDIKEIRVKEDERENTVSVSYEKAQAEVMIKYKSIDGNQIANTDIITLDIGREFIPEVKKEIIDSQNKKWMFQVANPIKLSVGSINNIITLSYIEKKANVLIKYIDNNGNVVKESVKIKAQVGSRFEPQNTNKVIYENEDVLRFSHNEPASIIVSENEAENEIVQVYSNERIDNNTTIKQEEKKSYYNPEIEKFIDKDLAEQSRKEEIEEKEIIQDNVSKVEFRNEKLKKLDREMVLSDSEKTAINKLDELNEEIVSIIKNSINEDELPNAEKLSENITQKMIEEKDIIQNELSNFLMIDKNSSKFYKILETIVENGESIKEIYMLEQKKAILLADYYTNKNIEEIEQATYICDKGIIEEELEIINSKEKELPSKEIIKTKVLLIYEREILNNYSKVRTILKDNYFKNRESKDSVMPQVAIMVSNMLPNRAEKLLQKIVTLDISKNIELDAMLNLMSEQQLGTLINMVEKIQDGKNRKMAIKKLKK